MNSPMLFQRVPLIMACLGLTASVHGGERDSLIDTVSFHTVHRIEAEALPGAILHTNRFLKGANDEKRTMNHAFSARLKYAFMPPENSLQARTYRGVYQGVGVAYNEYNPQLGNPFSVFVFQGARIAAISSQLSFNYEWNLGLTFGWNPYNETTNPDNKVIGSRNTAYLDADFYLAWRLSRQIDVNIGATVSHYSNGNTKFPNAGLNTAGVRVGVAWYAGRHRKEDIPQLPMPAFTRHMSYDVMVFGAWRRRGFFTNEGAFAVPGKFAVAGFNAAAMYNISHWFNAGLSLDGVYDHSANLQLDSYLKYGVIDENIQPPTSEQMALGLSARGEFVMPWFSINMGIGTNIINASRDFKGIYEVLALKTSVTRHVYVNIGYCLKDFRVPNYLMLGIGFRINNQRRF